MATSELKRLRPFDSRLRACRALPRPSLRDAQQDPDRQPTREHERAAVAEERQRNAGDRHEVERHAHVHENVNEPARARPNATRLPNESFARAATRTTRMNSSEEQRERDGHPDEPELLADHGEDEVSVLRRKKREPLLRCRACTPCQTSRRSRWRPVDCRTW